MRRSEAHTRIKWNHFDAKISTRNFYDFQRNLCQFDFMLQKYRIHIECVAEHRTDSHSCLNGKCKCIYHNLNWTSAHQCPLKVKRTHPLHGWVIEFAESDSRRIMRPYCAVAVEWSVCIENGWRHLLLSKKKISDCTARVIRAQFVFVILISIITTLWEKCCKQFQFFAIVVRHRKSILKCTQHFFLSLTEFHKQQKKQDSDIFECDQRTLTNTHTHQNTKRETYCIICLFLRGLLFFKERQRRIYRRREHVPHRLHDCFMNSVASQVNRTTTRLTVALHRRIVLAPSVV